MENKLGQNKTTDLTLSSRRKPWTKDDKELSILALPTFAWFLLFSYLPMFGLIISFKKYRITPGKELVAKMREELDKAGFKKIIETMQKQIDEAFNK